MDKQKKKYIRPSMDIYQMRSSAPILAGSEIPGLPAELIPPELAPFLP